MYTWKYLIDIYIYIWIVDITSHNDQPMWVELCSDFMGIFHGNVLVSLLG